MALVDVRPGLRTLLLNNAQITAMVQTRIYPVLLPQGTTLDSIVFTRITELDLPHMTGPTGLVTARFQFDAWSKDVDSAMTLADLVKEVLTNFRGIVNYDSTFVNIQGAFLLNGRDDYDSTSQMYRMSRDYYVYYGDRNA